MTTLHPTRRKRRQEAVVNQAAIVTCHAIGLSPDLIAQRLGVHRCTVFRHLGKIRSNQRINLRETAEALSRRAV